MLDATALLSTQKRGHSHQPGNPAEAFSIGDRNSDRGEPQTDTDTQKKTMH
jgi:hypothetical protein